MSSRDEVIAGGRELDDFLQTLAPKMQKNINRAGLRAGAAVLLEEVRQRIPVASGALRDSARITSRARGATVSASVKVGSKTVWYAHIVEYGTRPHKILPKRQGGAMQFGGIETRLVDHPGTRGRPFMRPAIDDKFPQVVQAVAKKIRERLTRQGLNSPAPNSDPAE